MSALHVHGRTLVVFLAWTLTSFLCHYMGRNFLRLVSDTDGGTLGTTLTAVFTLTSFQILFCVTLIGRPQSEGQANPKGIIYILTTHALATLMTNGSMAVIFAASTFAIKLLEPITGAIAQRVLLGTELSTMTLLSLPIIVSGAMLFTGNPLQEVTMSVGTTLACVSNISLALRNVAIKREHISKTEITWRRRGNVILVAYFTTIFLYVIVKYAFKLPTFVDFDKMAMLMATLVGSSLFHVIYSYISTAIVLKELSVVSHAVGNIFKRLFVIMLLYLGGQRTATVENFLGLMVCTAGLMLYTWDKIKHSPSQAGATKDIPKDVETQQS